MYVVRPSTMRFGHGGRLWRLRGARGFAWSGVDREGLGAGTAMPSLADRLAERSAGWRRTVYRRYGFRFCR